jgi:hypothetical protein
MRGSFKLRSGRLGRLPKARKKRRKGVKKRQISNSAVSRPLPTPAPKSGLIIIAKLPKMHFDELMKCYQNTVRILSDRGKSKEWHDQARVMRDAVGKEWKRRAKLPIGSDHFFKWPTTEAPGGTGRIDLHDLMQEGLLSYMQYRVGRTNGVQPIVRKILLDTIFMSSLPPVFPPNYLLQWGAPKTAWRLQKMAETLAAFIRNAKRRNDDRLDDAIGEWEHDFRYLYERYYIRHFHFSWPTTRV